MSIASDLGKAYKKGDSAKCIKARDNKKARHDYCIAAFSDDYAQLSYCRETEEFCETCCQAEFGEMMSAEKEECLKKVCNKNPPKPDSIDSSEAKPPAKSDNEDVREITDSTSNDKSGTVKQTKIPIE